MPSRLSDGMRESLPDIMTENMSDRMPQKEMPMSELHVKCQIHRQNIWQIEGQNISNVCRLECQNLGQAE